MISIGIQVVVHDPAGGHVIHDIAQIERAELSPETLGLSLADGKAITASIQRVIAAEQIAVWQAAQRICRACGRS